MDKVLDEQLWSWIRYVGTARESPRMDDDEKLDISTWKTRLDQLETHIAKLSLLALKQHRTFLSDELSEMAGEIERLRKHYSDKDEEDY